MGEHERDRSLPSSLTCPRPPRSGPGGHTIICNADHRRRRRRATSRRSMTRRLGIHPRRSRTPRRSVLRAISRWNCPTAMLFTSPATARNASAQPSIWADPTSVAESTVAPDQGIRALNVGWPNGRCHHDRLIPLALRGHLRSCSPARRACGAVTFRGDSSRRAPVGTPGVKRRPARARRTVWAR